MQYISKYKYIVLFVFFLLCFSIAGFSQTDKKSSPNKKGKFTTFGLYAGPNLSRLSSDDTEEYEGRIGYDFGMYSRVGRKLYFQFGVEGSRTSTTPQVLADASPRSIYDNVDINTLRVPVYAGWKVISSKDGSSGVRLAAGASYSKVMRVKRMNEGGKFKSDYNENLYGLDFGIGFDLWIFTTDLTYHHGMSDMLIGTDSKNKMVSYTVGIKF